MFDFDVKRTTRGPVGRNGGVMPGRNGAETVGYTYALFDLPPWLDSS